ncbi:MAG: GTPase HflX [Patescibacteria group bacterium]|nr:GTPase HflX [Patescibacteria group bacterium]
MASKLRFVIAHVFPPHIRREESEENLTELMNLIDTFGGATVVKIIQRRANPDTHTYIGSGKASELADIVRDEKIDVVVVNDIVKPGQLYNLQKMLWGINPRIQVWDRVDLIIGIFDEHANTAEAKLQIRLARMRHMGPRIYGMGMALSRQGGGIGTRGLGETNTELMKRHWRTEIKKVEEELDRLATNRGKQLQRRRDLGFRTISIVGYTNAGKSTLFNTLTGKNKKSEDALFATLDSAVGKLFLPGSRTGVLVSDTIGFISNLPTTLVQAFQSTLMESVDADILIHVIDASDPRMYDKITVVEKVLEDLGIRNKPTIHVFHKIDRLTRQQMLALLKQYKPYAPQLASAKTGLGIPELIERIESVVAEFAIHEERKGRPLSPIANRNV